MPHTNRKKKTAGSTPRGEEKKPLIVHTKRKEVEDEEGWTHIIDTPRTRSATLKSKSKAPALHGGDFEINGVSYINRTLEELKADYEYWRKAWEESDAHKDLVEKIEVGKEGKRSVDNVVLLGLGSLQSSRREGRRSSATQLAALQTIIQTLGGDMKLVAQDPQFTDLDKEFLTSLGYTVVEDPEAFKSIEEGSMVYAIHCYARVYKAVSEVPRPVLLIGTDVGNFGRFDTSDAIEDIAKSLEDMVGGCEQLDFPQIRHDFSDTKIYWRGPSQPDTAKVQELQPDAALLEAPKAENIEIEEPQPDTLKVEESQPDTPLPEASKTKDIGAEPSQPEANQSKAFETETKVLEATVFKQDVVKPILDDSQETELPKPESAAS